MMGRAGPPKDGFVGYVALVGLCAGPEGPFHLARRRGGRGGRRGRGGRGVRGNDERAQHSDDHSPSSSPPPTATSTRTCIPSTISSHKQPNCTDFQHFLSLQQCRRATDATVRVRPRLERPPQVGQLLQRSHFTHSCAHSQQRTPVSCTPPCSLRNAGCVRARGSPLALRCRDASECAQLKQVRARRRPLHKVRSMKRFSPLCIVCRNPAMCGGVAIEFSSRLSLWPHRKA